MQKKQYHGNAPHTKNKAKGKESIDVAYRLNPSDQLTRFYKCALYKDIDIDIDMANDLCNLYFDNLRSRPDNSEIYTYHREIINNFIHYYEHKFKCLKIKGRKITTNEGFWNYKNAKEIQDLFGEDRIQQSVTYIDKWVTVYERFVKLQRYLYDHVGSTIYGEGSNERDYILNLCRYKGIANKIRGDYYSGFVTYFVPLTTHVKSGWRCTPTGIVIDTKFSWY